MVSRAIRPDHGSAYRRRARSMTSLVRTARAQLQLPLETARVFPHPLEQTRRDVVEALADLLLEALGTEAVEPNGAEEVKDESKDHA
jgi:hypothetical protein